MSGVSAAEVRERVGHPIVDTDGHLLEVLPHVAEHVDALAGAAFADRFLAAHGPMYRAGNKAIAWWGSPRDALDRATAFVPRLLHERLPELGFDYSVVYPTHGLSAAAWADPDDRRVVVRAFNAYYAAAIEGLEDRLTIPAVIPMVTPDEAIAELEHAVQDLGLKAAMCSGYVRRSDENGEVIDLLAIDSAFDYDPFWQRCVDLGVAVTFHTGGMNVGFRSSSTYMFNHIGHFADAGHAAAKAMVMGGVTRRFPTLNFAFLEGGAAWGVALLADLIARWEKRGGPNIWTLSPDRLDVERFFGLLEQYGGDRYATEEVRQATAYADGGHPEELDDFRHTEVKSAEDLVELFVPRFYFGCEADDPTNVWAFAADRNPFGVRLRAMIGSDVGHWDVPDMRDVLCEAYELLEDGVLTVEDFRAFTVDNAVRLHGGMNPEFFAGTTVASYAAELLR